MCSSVVERCPDKTEVEGPIPSTLTKLFAFGCNLLPSDSGEVADYFLKNGKIVSFCHHTYKIWIIRSVYDATVVQFTRLASDGISGS